MHYIRYPMRGTGCAGVMSTSCVCELSVNYPGTVCRTVCGFFFSQTRCPPINTVILHEVRCINDCKYTGHRFVIEYCNMPGHVSFGVMQFSPLRQWSFDSDAPTLPAALILRFASLRLVCLPGSPIDWAGYSGWLSGPILGCPLIMLPLGGQ